MRVIIVGAGVVGATTAYFVAKRGHDVTLLERHAEVGRECSFANAGQLAYSYTDTLADPGLLRRLPKILLGRDRGMRVRLDAALLSWGLRFLAHCTREHADGNTLRLLQLAALSKFAMDELLAAVPLDFGKRVAGKLLITSSAQTLARLRQRAELKRQRGVVVEIVDAQRCRELEPALSSWRGEIAGAAYSPEDGVGDAQRFAHGLCEQLIARNMSRVLTNSEVQSVMHHGGRVVGVRTSNDVLDADAVVICAGVGTRKLLREVGLDVPIYPLKGYSVTADVGSKSPQISITDLERRMVFANFGAQLRLAGLADCVGHDAAVDPHRIAELVSLGRNTLPEAARFDGAVQAWAGLRPATPSGLPIVGATRMRGLYLNVGHGGLGWTLACGTAQQLAEQLLASVH